MFSPCQAAKNLESAWERVPDEGYPQWFTCGFNAKSLHYFPFKVTIFKLMDWSVCSSEHNYKTQLNDKYTYEKLS